MTLTVGFDLSVLQSAIGSTVQVVFVTHISLHYDVLLVWYFSQSTSVLIDEIHFVVLARVGQMTPVEQFSLALLLIIHHSMHPVFAEAHTYLYFE